MYPEGCVPTFLALIQTSAFMYTPSKRTESRPSLGRGGVGKDFRYQPMPPTVQAVAALPRLRPLLKGPISVGQVQSFHKADWPSVASGGRSSMLQSWGRSTLRHAKSSKAGSSAPGASPRLNRQPSSKLCSRCSLALRDGVACPSANTSLDRTEAVARVASPLSASRRLTLYDMKLFSPFTPAVDYAISTSATPPRGSMIVSSPRALIEIASAAGSFAASFRSAICCA